MNVIEARPKHAKAARSGETSPSAEAAERVGPERTCVGCRQRAGRGEVVRLAVADDGRVALDPRARASGRGAWVHPRRACVAQMVKRHAAERSLKVEAQPALDAGALVEGLREATERQARSLILVSARTRRAAVGADAVVSALQRVKVYAVVVARDAGDVAKALAAEGEGEGTRVLRYGTRSSLGALFGRAEVALIALLEPRVSAELGAAIERLRELED